MPSKYERHLMHVMVSDPATVRKLWLSPREREILDLVRIGANTTNDVADALIMEMSQAYKYLFTLYSKGYLTRRRGKRVGNRGGTNDLYYLPHFLLDDAAPE